VGEVASLSRTLEHELLALLRGASLECLVCGEFVLYEDDAIVCPECDSRLERRVAREEVQLNLQTGA
jgi:Zn finger protein HypA/HybF involved in hydrogenase expression